MSLERLLPLSRDHYRWFMPLATRWADNDQYGHINNVAYYGFFDTAVNVFLIEHAGLKPLESSWLGLVAETRCSYFAPLSFPQPLEIGIGVDHMGRSSVRYSIGIFANGAEQCAARGFFTHVYIGRDNQRPIDLPVVLREALIKIQL